MTSTNMFSNFGGFRYSPHKLVDAFFHGASFCLKMCGEATKKHTLIKTVSVPTSSVIIDKRNFLLSHFLLRATKYCEHAADY